MVQIRDEIQGDIEAIRHVHEEAFPTHDEAKLVDVLRITGRLSVSMVAVVNHEVVGHVAFSPVVLDDQPKLRGVGLAPVAVLPDYQCRGIGSRLIRSGIKACEKVGYAFIVVLGEPVYYQRFGFSQASRMNLSNEYGAGDAFMVIELRDGALPVDGGLVRYAPEFAGLEN